MPVSGVVRCGSVNCCRFSQTCSFSCLLGLGFPHAELLRAEGHHFQKSSISPSKLLRSLQLFGSDRRNASIPFTGIDESSTGEHTQALGNLPEYL